MKDMMRNAHNHPPLPKLAGLKNRGYLSQRNLDLFAEFDSQDIVRLFE